MGAASSAALRLENTAGRRKSTPRLTRCREWILKRITTGRKQCLTRGGPDITAIATTGLYVTELRNQATLALHKKSPRTVAASAFPEHS